MKLTRRQQMFLSKFLDLYRREEKPLHYTTVAEYLGINPITAYDMLRLLEERGLVTSDYIPPSQRERAGRSIVVFLPTPATQALFDKLAGDDWDREEWEAVKARILQALREGKGTDYHDLLEDLLARIPDRRSPMLYVTEMVTAVILSLYLLGVSSRRSKEETATSPLFENLRALGLPGELGLNALVGLTVGLSYVERANRRITNFLLSHISRYREMLSRLSGENRRRLADFVGEVMEIAEM
jgi:DNA-binding MarR family transcriptional regulator